MSYILDALRRADAEREKGSVPGLHAQPVPALSTDARPRATVPPWTWIALGAVAGPAIALAWYFASRQVGQSPVEPVNSTPPVVASPAPATRPAPSEQPTPVGPVAMPAPVPAPVAEPRRAVASPAAEHSATEAGATAPSRSQPATRIVAREDLPEAVRRQLPNLVAGGSIYSSNPANRSLIINGRLYREGDAVADDLSLAEIRLKSAVLRYRDYLFEIRF